MGTLTYADGDKYVGSWYAGKKSGEGELIYSNGDVFRGNWLDDKAHGEGILEYANGDLYQGMWENDQRGGFYFIDIFYNKIYLMSTCACLLLYHVAYRTRTVRIS